MIRQPATNQAREQPEPDEAGAGQHAAPRFFVDFPLAVGQQVELPEALAHQVRRVLRLRPGAALVLLNGDGLEYSVELTALDGQRAVGQVLATRRNGTEPRAAVTLYAAPLKGDHFAYTLQKATEIGAAAFVPVLTARTIAGEANASKVERWQRIVREAAEQARRGRVPPVRSPMVLAEAFRLATAAGPGLILWEEEARQGLREAIAALPAARGVAPALGVFIGPEGGFSPAEVALAREAGIIPVTLGARILRAETAAAVATALALAALGEMD